MSLGSNEGGKTRKVLTFLVVTNDKGSTRKISIPVSWLKTGAIAAAILAVVTSTAAVDYFGLLLQTVENKRLRAENTQLRSQFQVVEGKLITLENSLERVKTFTTKLKMITNVDEEDRTLKLAMGPLPKFGQAVEEFEEPMDHRQPASTLAVRDSIFFQKPPVDEKSGELSAEGQRDYASLSIRIDQAVKETQLREQGILELWETLSERQSLMSATPRIRPAYGWITSTFGNRISPFSGKIVMHTGVDIASAPGSPVYAPADGVVSFAGYDPGYGKLVSIDHGYGVVTRYGHNSQIFVVAGQRIKQRDVIASVGNTGRSTGPHLHYEVRVNDIPVDPKTFMLDE